MLSILGIKKISVQGGYSMKDNLLLTGIIGISDIPFTAEELTGLLRSVNQEVVEEEEVLSDRLYYYDWGKKEMRRA
jgi:hypothetical protein